MKAKKIKETDTSTEDKIKTAARVIFTQKGYAATRTRDIASEAGINLALLNYYFRSKEKLFDIIMLESLQGFMQHMAGVFNNKETTLMQKIETFAGNYIDLLITQPGIPLFILSELRTNPKQLISNMNLKEMVQKSYFMTQLKQASRAGGKKTVHPLHLLINMAGMTVFPFIANPMIKKLGDLEQEDFNAMMLQRKKLIPLWMNAILTA